MIDKIKFNDNVEKYLLNNGVTLICEYIESYQTTSIGFFVKRGSRDENENQAGYSHFCEHMLFKGTNKYNKQQIALKFDEVGGFINAYTSYELVTIYNRVPYFYLMDILKLTENIFNDSTFDEIEIDLEKEVILSEINSVLEDPHEKIHEDFMQTMFPDSGLGRPIIGNEKSIKNLTRDDIYEYYKNSFYSDDLIISIAGKIDTNQILDYLNSVNFRRNSKNINKKAISNTNNNSFTLMHSEQFHILTGVSNFDMDNDTYLKCGLLNIFIGESMSSCLFQRIREELGLCYSIYSFFNKYREESLFGIYMSVNPKNVNRAISETSKLIKQIKDNGINKNQLEQIKKQKIGELILNYDILHKRMQRNGLLEIRYGRYYDLQYVIDIINKTTIEDLNELINKIFIKDNFVTQYLYKKEIKTEEWNF